MLNLPMWVQIWIFAICAALLIAWLFVTVGCAMGEYSKKFQIKWAIFNVILLIIATVIVAVLE